MRAGGVLLGCLFLLLRGSSLQFRIWGRAFDGYPLGMVVGISGSARIGPRLVQYYGRQSVNIGGVTADFLCFGSVPGVTLVGC